MAARTEELAANGRAVSDRFRIRDLVAIMAVVFAGVGAMTAGMQWAVSTNLAPLLLEMQAQRSEVGVLREDVGALRSEVGVLREDVGKLGAEVEENRRQIADLRERVAKVEVGLAQVQANQARILEILEHERRARE